MVSAPALARFVLLEVFGWLESSCLGFGLLAPISSSISESSDRASTVCSEPLSLGSDSDPVYSKN